MITKSCWIDLAKTKVRLKLENKLVFAVARVTNFKGRRDNSIGVDHYGYQWMWMGKMEGLYEVSTSATLNQTIFELLPPLGKKVEQPALTLYSAIVGWTPTEICQCPAGFFMNGGNTVKKRMEFKVVKIKVLGKGSYGVAYLVKTVAPVYNQIYVLKSANEEYSLFYARKKKSF
ncbi:hypothetical protein Gotur_035848 [Gossypium turneri]